MSTITDIPESFMKDGFFSFRTLEKINHSQYKIMYDDFKEFGSEDSGEYNGIKWEMNRPCNTYWCGYVKTDIKLTDEEYDKLSEYSHRDLTAYMGFDCAHYNDYPICIKETSKFRTHEYVLNCLKDMIDYIVLLEKK